MKPLFGSDIEKIERQVENPVKFYIRHNMGGSTGGVNAGKIFVKNAETGNEEIVEKVECLLLAVRYKGMAVRPSDKLTAYTSFEKVIKGNNNIALYFRSPGSREDHSGFQLRGSLAQIESHLESNAFGNSVMAIRNVMYVLYKGEIAQFEIKSGDSAKFINFSKTSESPFFLARQDAPEGLNYWLTFEEIKGLTAEGLGESEKEKIEELRAFLNESDEIAAHYNRGNEQ